MEQGVWQEIEQLYQKFQKLGISESVDYDKYYLYSLITHSTAIEGSTLTELDTQLLFDEGVTAKGKPLVHHLMNEDLKQAYELAKAESESFAPITPAFLKRLNAMLMRTTGSVHSVMGGSFDSSKGEFRLCGVTAGVGGYSYMNYLKVPAKVDELCAILKEKQKKVGIFREQYELSFNAHLNLVTIHPWVDGNGRTARLLMNYIQFCYHLFPTKIFKEDREEYILSLRQCQDEETNQPFLDFMAGQLKKSLSLEIESFKASQKKGVGFVCCIFLCECCSLILNAKHNKGNCAVVPDRPFTFRGYTYHTSFRNKEYLAVYLKFSVSTKEEIKFFMCLVSVKKTGFCSRLE